MTGLVASAEIDIKATPDRVWEALTDPAQVAEYMFGTRIESTWQPGTPITWQGEYEGKKYKDHGEVLEVLPGHRLKVTHFSPLSGQKDAPENYHTVTYELAERGGHTHVLLKQDNNSSVDEAKHSAANWEAMLAGLKKHVEESA
jgi:uncharacterized protein YndB with AHSA1/START domain